MVNLFFPFVGVVFSPLPSSSSPRFLASFCPHACSAFFLSLPGQVMIARSTTILPRTSLSSAAVEGEDAAAVNEDAAAVHEDAAAAVHEDVAAAVHEDAAAASAPSKAFSRVTTSKICLRLTEGLQHVELHINRTQSSENPAPVSGRLKAEETE